MHLTSAYITYIDYFDPIFIRILPHTFPVPNLYPNSRLGLKNMIFFRLPKSPFQQSESIVHWPKLQKVPNESGFHWLPCYFDESDDIE